MKELIELSKKIGFESTYFNSEHLEADPIEFYLWMCELQKYLRDEYIIFVYLRRVTDSRIKEQGWRYAIMSVNNFTYHDTYEQALEQSLIEAIKIIL